MVRKINEKEMVYHEQRQDAEKRNIWGMGYIWLKCRVCIRKEKMRLRRKVEMSRMYKDLKFRSGSRKENI